MFYEGAVRSELLDVMNDTYFLSRNPMHPLLSRDKFEFVGRFGKVFVYRNLTAMPRAWMSDARAFSDNGEVLEALKGMGVEARGLRRTALVVAPALARGPKAPGDARGTPEGRETVRAVKGNVRVSSRSAHRLALSVEPRCRGLLVVSEVYYPGWEAYVDGRKAEILRTDLLFSGIMLDGGQRNVEFRFRPASFRKGAVISLAALAATALYFTGLLALWTLRRKRGNLEALGDNPGAQRTRHNRRGDRAGQEGQPGRPRPGDSDS